MVCSNHAYSILDIICTVSTDVCNFRSSTESNLDYLSDYFLVKLEISEQCTILLPSHHVAVIAVFRSGQQRELGW